MSWFPNNLACNSLAYLSNIEIESLVLQRLWWLLNCQENELHAKFLGEVGVWPGRGWGAYPLRTKTVGARRARGVLCGRLAQPRVGT